jgi:hypothetical protein
VLPRNIAKQRRGRRRRGCSPSERVVPCPLSPVPRQRVEGMNKQAGKNQRWDKRQDDNTVTKLLVAKATLH